jgi:hypothetical protein
LGVGPGREGESLMELFASGRIICRIIQPEVMPMGRYLLLWLLGVPIPILILIWAFGGLH